MASTAPTTAWVTITLNAGWANFTGYQPARYRKWLGLVIVQGLLQNTSGSSSSASPFTLPAGFRPSATHALPGPFLTSLNIPSTGVVTPVSAIGNGGLLTAECIFLAEA
jgi:hypothetical protein